MPLVRVCIQSNALSAVIGCFCDIAITDSRDLGLALGCV